MKQLTLDAIKAFAEGKRIKATKDDLCIITHESDHNSVVFFDDYKYEILSNKWYRVAEINDNGSIYIVVVTRNVEEPLCEQKEYFVRWLTDRVYYD